jgi:hypothetical protein
MAALRVLARTAATARGFALATEIELRGEPLLDQVIDRGLRVQPSKLLTLELGERRINPWIS